MDSTPSPNRTKRIARKKKSIACRRCHAQKIKCSGEQPCIKCQRSGHAVDCIYPSRDKVVKVTKSYLDSVVADNCRLLEQLASLQGASVRGVPSQAFSLSTSSLDHEDIQIKNPLVGDKAWFQTYKSYLPPIYIGEAACTACASRLRQLLAGDSSPSHITRVEWTKDAVLSTAAKPGTPWPDLGQAQLLVRIALNHLSKTYHVVLKHDALDGLEKVYQTVQFDDPTREAHYFVLFALGQAHSAPTARRDQLPGLEYYAQALDLMRTRPERSSLVYIETLVLLALFCFLLDRRHTGYVLISDAMRYGVTLGLHHTLPESQLSGPIEREHRIRLWWTLYILDREWSVKLGFPIHLPDADISVDMPSAGAIHQSSELHSAQFPEDTRRFMARIHHARIVGEIASNIYSLRQFKESFLHRVQRSLQMLHDWMQSLLQDTDIGSQLLPKSMVDLHLSFNQAIIVTTRPILFFLLTRTMSEQRMHPGLDTTTVTKSPTIPTPLIQLGQVCIQAARSSYTLLIDQ